MSSEVREDPFASSSSLILDALKSKYTCIHEPLPAVADSASPDDNQRYLTSLRVFGNREVEEPQSPLSASSTKQTVEQNIIDPQRIKEKVTAALEALRFRDPRVLVQFWSPVAVRNRLLLTTLDQPFGLGVVDERLYEYRLKSEQHMFVVDEDHGEELHPPARVYLQKLPEWSVDINDVSSPQDWAAYRNIRGYICLPVIEPRIDCCLGVIELITLSNYVDFAFEVQQVSRALKDENLKSPNVLEDTNSYARVGDETRQLELNEIFQVLKTVSDIHDLHLAQTWGPCGYSSVVANSGNLEKSCSSFNRNCIGKTCMSTAGLPFYVQDLSKWEFHEACRSRHLDKSQGVVGKSLSSRGFCFCGDVSQLDVDKYPMVPYARTHGITGCLGIYLKSIEAGDEYVVELFLPAQNENEADIQSLVKTVKQQIKSASRIQLDDISSTQVIEVISCNRNLESPNLSVKEEVPPVLENYIDYYNDPIKKRKITGAAIDFDEISKVLGKSLKEDAHILGVSKSTIKRFYRRHDIHRWPYSRTFNSKNRSRGRTTLINNLFRLERIKKIAAITDYAYVADQWPSKSASMEEVCDNFVTNTVNVNVKFKDSTECFRYLLFDGLLNLERHVVKRFKLEGQRIRLKYIDEDGDLILISHDDDLKFAVDRSGRMCLICLVD